MTPHVPPSHRACVCPAWRGHGSRRGRPRKAGRGNGFTLVEMLIVVGIIVLLIAIAVLIGARVAGAGRQRLTEHHLKALETSLSAFSHGGDDPLPPPLLVDPDHPDRRLPVADARSGESEQIINSVGLYLAQCRGNPDAEAAFASIEPRYLKPHDPDGVGPGNRPANLQPVLLTLFDGWGNPIRYVHPTFKGTIVGPWGSPAYPPTQYVPLRYLTGDPMPGTAYGIAEIRRNDRVLSGAPAADGPDADGGLPHANRPYFYSAGPDGKVGYEIDGSGNIVADFNADNVYLALPRFPKN